MNSKIIFSSLIFVLIVSIACVGIYAHPGTDLSHNDTIDKNTGENVEGLYISGSGNVCHVPGYHHPDQEPQKENNNLLVH